MRKTKTDHWAKLAARMQEFQAKLDADPDHQADVARWDAEEKAAYEKNTPAQVKRLNQRLRDDGVNTGEGAALGGALDLLLADKDAVESAVALIHACLKWADRHSEGKVIWFVLEASQRINARNLSGRDGVVAKPNPTEKRS